MLLAGRHRGKVSIQARPHHSHHQEAVESLNILTFLLGALENIILRASVIYLGVCTNENP